MELADRAGLEALTMRALGDSLGVEAMSLYNHVPNKDTLLQSIADLVVGEIVLPQPGERWEPSVRRCALSAHEAFMRHPWACGLVMAPSSSPSVSPVVDARLTYIEALLRCFREGGFSPPLSYHAYHSIDSHVFGFTLWELGHSMPVTLTDELLQSYMSLLAPGVFPNLAEHAAQHLHGLGDGVEQSEFEFGLDLVIEGLKRRLRRERTTTRTRSG
jgi:AcrR family transcriptional regulator